MKTFFNKLNNWLVYGHFISSKDLETELQIEELKHAIKKYNKEIESKSRKIVHLTNIYADMDKRTSPARRIKADIEIFELAVEALNRDLTENKTRLNKILNGK